MKKLLATLTLLSIISFSTAQAVDLTLSPVYTAINIVKSVVVTAVLPFASSTATTAGSVETYKALQAVRSDAIEFMATDVMSEKLEDAVEAVRSEVPAYENASNKRISAAIISSIQ